MCAQSVERVLVEHENRLRKELKSVLRGHETVGDGMRVRETPLDQLRPAFVERLQDEPFAPVAAAQ